MPELGTSIRAVFNVGIIFYTSVHDESKYETESSLSGRELTEKNRQNFYHFYWISENQFWPNNLSISQFTHVYYVSVRDYVGVGVRDCVGVYDHVGRDAEAEAVSWISRFRIRGWDSY